MTKDEALILLKSAFKSLNTELTEEEWAYVANHCIFQKRKSKSIIIEEGRIQKNIYFLTSGLIRGFYINDEGKEITIRFINHQGWTTHYSALIGYTPSKYIFQALEISEIIALPFSVIQEGYNKYKGLERFGRLVAEHVLKTQQRRIESFQFLNAEQRYLNFIENHPALYNRISLTHLSSYIGIQRQSLTRIRQKLASK